MTVDLDLDLSFSELSSPSLLGKQCLAEMLGTMVLVLVGCGSCIGGEALDDQANIVRISLTFGLTVATLAAALGHVSGCHINPAVTLGLTVAGKVGILQSCLYMASQSVGAVMGSGILWVFLYNEQGSPLLRGSPSLGVTALSPEITIVQGLIIETIISCVLVMVVFGAAVDKGKCDNDLGSPGLAIGLAVTTCHLFAIPLTGSSMNPARSLGPAVILGQYSHQWIYWTGPLIGGLLAAILYQAIFAVRPGPQTNS